MAKAYIRIVSIYGIEQFVVFLPCNNFTTTAKIFASSISLTGSLKPSLSFKASMILDLYRIRLLKCRHYTPETCFQTAYQQT